MVPRRPGLVATAVAIAASLASAPALASPSAKLVYLRASGTESCPAEAELRKAVAVRIGYDPFFPVAQKTVVAQVQRVPHGYRGKVQIVGDDGVVRGERDLATTGEDCTELVGALALAVSIALDDLDEPAPAPPAPPSSPPAPRETEQPAPTKPPPSAIERRDAAVDRPVPTTEKSAAELSVSLGPTVSLGTAPDAAAGANVAALLGWRSSFALRLDLQAELPASRGIAGGRLATNAAFATLSACLRGRIPFACIGSGAGVLFSRTSGITHPARDQASLLVAAVRGGVDVALGKSLYLEPFLEIGGSFLARTVIVDGRSAYETTPVWGVTGLHLGARVF